MNKIEQNKLEQARKIALDVYRDTGDYMSWQVDVPRDMLDLLAAMGVPSLELPEPDFIMDAFELEIKPFIFCKMNGFLIRNTKKRNYFTKLVK